MPSILVQRYKNTVPACYNRLKNSVAGSAQACMDISRSLGHPGGNAACTRAALDLLSCEFLGIHEVFQDLVSMVDDTIWHENAMTTVKHTQKVCQQVADQARDIVRRTHNWTVVVPDHINDKLHALAISLQEQQITLHLLTTVMVFVDPWVFRPRLLESYRITRYVERRFK